jgi:DNA-binding transcriptional LysR family regulator
MLIRRFDPTSLTLFVAVCTERSITKAAEREHTAPSAVSNRIAELEEAVKATLLYRHQRGVTPTPAGECLLKHARLVLHSMEKMCSELSEYSVGLAGKRKDFRESFGDYSVPGRGPEHFLCRKRECTR